MKKDYRTWWNKYGLDDYPLNDVYFDHEEFLEPKLINNTRNVDCMVEQLWAIREGLA